MSRNVHDVLAEIRRIVYREDESVIRQWAPVFAKFREYEVEVSRGDYWNQSPESIEYERWMLLHWYVNELIQHQTTENTWQQDVVDAYMGTSSLPISTDHIQIFPMPVEEEKEDCGQWNEFDEEYEFDEEAEREYEEEWRQLVDEDRARSKQEARRFGW